MSNEQLKVKQIKVKSTKRMLTHFKSEDYSVPLMLSEFIDNSISSWEKGYTNSEIIQKKDRLKIHIIFREKYVNDQKREKQIIIKDNAFGMNFDEIEKAADFYDSKGKSKEDLNQHGIGLKSAIGWFGEDMTIISKTKDDTQFFNILEFDTTNFEAHDDWYVTAKQVEINKTNRKTLLGESGTNITIDKIYDDEKFDYIKYEEQRSALLIFLGWKYKYYIRDGLIINLSFNLDDKDKKDNSEYIVGDFEITPWKLSNFKTYISKKVIDSFKNLDSDIQSEENVDEFQKEIISNFLDNIKTIMEKSEPESLKYDICNHILDDNPLLIKQQITIDDKLFDIDLGIISSDSLKYSIAKKSKSKFTDNYYDIKKKYSFGTLQGISTFHHNRGIEIGPFINKSFWDKKMPQTISFAKDRRAINGESTPIRLYGEIHLKDFSTEINKAKLIWDVNNLDDFKDDLSKIWEDSFDEILQEIVETENKCKKNQKIKLKSKTIEKTFLDSAEKMKFGMQESVGNHECINGKHNWIYKAFYNDSEYVFSLLEDNLENRPFKCNQVSDNEYKIFYDFNHSIWHPINSDYANARILAHPIIVTLALAQYIIDQSQNTKSTMMFGKKSARIDIFSIIDDLVKNWKQYE